jgi:hypothetical protein
MCSKTEIPGLPSSVVFAQKFILSPPGEHKVRPYSPSNHPGAAGSAPTMIRQPVSPSRFLNNNNPFPSF